MRQEYMSKHRLKRVFKTPMHYSNACHFDYIVEFIFNTV